MSSFISSVLVPLSANLLMLQGAGFLFGRGKSLLEAKIKNRTAGKVILGTAMGLLGVLALPMGVSPEPGIYVDTRVVIMAVNGFTGGLLQAVVAATILTLFRLFLGGGGALGGVMAIWLSAALGVIFYYRFRKDSLGEIKTSTLIRLGVIVTVFNLPTLPMIKPFETAVVVFRQVWLIWIILYPLAFAVMAGSLGSTYSQDKMMKRLRDLAATDYLTGLANRREFYDFLRREMNKSRRTKTPVSLIITDIDDFKAFNDTHGHIAGDQCLETMAKVFKDQLRSYDLVSRWGGEEFAFVLPLTDAQAAVSVAERIRSAVESCSFRSIVAGDIVTNTISLGVTTFTGGAETMQQVLNRADAALYQAKEKKNNVVYLPLGS